MFVQKYLLNSPPDIIIHEFAGVHHYYMLRLFEGDFISAGDCKAAFNCRSLSTSSENYSTGSTYFIRANETAACHLEAIALQFFSHHTSGIEYDKSTSGAEWWTQAIDSRDDIGFHWDRDYGAEEERGEHLYPLFGTVTYLTNEGGPTLIMDREGTADSAEPLIGSVQQFHASRPVTGKHIAFSGNLLHAAPSDLNDDEEEDGSDESSDEEDAEGKSEDGPLRITFLVNIWINHIPSQSKRFPKKDLKNLSPVRSELKVNLNSASHTLTKKWELAKTDCTREKRWEFHNSGINYDVKVPLPDVETTTQALNENDMVHFVYKSGSSKSYSGHGVEILFSENQPSDLEDENENSNDDESEIEEEEPTPPPSKKKRRY